jgi:hypothetical protein
MKTFFRLAAVAAALALTSCASGPQLLDQNISEAPPESADRIVIVLAQGSYTNPLYGEQGRSYLKGLHAGLESAFSDVPTNIADFDSLTLSDEIPQLLEDTRPSHLIYVFPVSALTRGSLPITATWEVDVYSTTPVTMFPSDVRSRIESHMKYFPSLSRRRFTPIYKANVEGDVCLSSDSDAKQCGDAIGKLLGESVRAANVMKIKSEPQP